MTPYIPSVHHISYDVVNSIVLMQLSPTFLKVHTFVKFFDHITTFYVISNAYLKLLLNSIKLLFLYDALILICNAYLQI